MVSQRIPGIQSGCRARTNGGTCRPALSGAALVHCPVLGLRSLPGAGFRGNAPPGAALCGQTLYFSLLRSMMQQCRRKINQLGRTLPSGQALLPHGTWKMAFLAAGEKEKSPRQKALPHGQGLSIQAANFAVLQAAFFVIRTKRDKGTAVGPAPEPGRTAMQEA